MHSFVQLGVGAGGSGSDQVCIWADPERLLGLFACIITIVVLTRAERGFFVSTDQFNTMLEIQ